VLINNIASNNEWNGIYISDSNNNILTNNIVSNNKNWGIYLEYSNSNLIYNNIFNNPNNVYVYKGTNTWNIIKTPGRNIIGGNYLGGNAWLKPDGTGFSQTCNDTDGDGICDKPFKINDNNIDYLPLKFVRVKGDFNFNGRVDIGDVCYVASIVVGKKPQDLRADFNNNGRVDIGDLAKIAYYLMGKIDKL